MAGPRILALWSPPRCRSTAFFRMMLQRGDFLVVHEPFSVLYEQGSVEILGVTVRSAADVLARLRELAVDTPVFFKDTTDCRYPEVLADSAFLGQDAVHTFLVRDPAEAIASYYALNPAVTRDQIGFETLYELYGAVRVATGEEPVVLDSAELIGNTADAVRAYCARVGIPFRPDALSWQPGNRPEWQATDRWHATVASTTGIAALPTAHGVVVDDVPHLRGYLDHHLPFYRQLIKER